MSNIKSTFNQKWCKESEYFDLTMFMATETLSHVFAYEHSAEATKTFEESSKMTNGCFLHLSRKQTVEQNHFVNLIKQKRFCKKIIEI